jgi:hypothetical protein
MWIRYNSLTQTNSNLKHTSIDRGCLSEAEVLMLDRRPRYCWRTLKSPALFIHGRRGSLRPEFLKQVTPSNPVKNNCNRALPVCRPKISTKLGHTLQKVYTEGWLPSLNCTFCKGDGQPVGGCWNWGGGASKVWLLHMDRWESCTHYLAK